MKEIYLDHAATAPLKKEVLAEMMPYLTTEYGNPSAIYRSAQRAKSAISRAREQVAKVISAKADEIYFTSGGTEADNWVLKASFEAFGKEKPHIITSAIEHHAVLETCHYLEEKGAEITYISPEKNGSISPEKIREAITDNTCLISIMSANNETGIIEPIREIGRIAHENGIYFHTDAVQAYGHISIDISENFIDFLSISAHKIGGPKGVGALFIKKGIPVKSFIHGGMQERARRAGTENVAGIVGFGKAAEIAGNEMEEASVSLIRKRDYLVKRILTEIPDTSLNGEGERLPGHINIAYHGLDGESLLIYLDMHGIACSAGSACASGSLSPSHVLTAMGMSYEDAHASIRMSLSDENTTEELDEVLEILKEGCLRLRNGGGF